MFKSILCADLHLNDDSKEELGYGIQLLNDCGSIALSRKISSVFVLGDFFHWKHRFSQEILLLTHSRLSYWQRKGVEFIIIRGNHDSPQSEDSENTILNLFNKVATIVTSPVLVEEEDCVIVMLPWYPPDQFRKLLKHYASYAVGYSKPRILMTHVSLQEGKVSPSNTRITTPIRVVDLIPEIWTGGIYLGDYHNHQTVETRKEYTVVYLGAPRPTTFGDFNTVGVWELSVIGGVSKLLPLPLTSRYPAFYSHRVDSLVDLPLRNYDARDRHRVYCSLRFRNHIANLYPAAKILPIETSPVECTGRLGEIDKMDAVATAEKWRKLKGLGDEFKKPIKQYLVGG